MCEEIKEVIITKSNFYEKENGITWYSCPNCEHGWIMSAFKYCPICGSIVKWNLWKYS